MNLKEAEVAIKQGEPSVLEGVGILLPAAKKGYICVECGSGSGDKGTGTRDFCTDKGYVIQKCFNCGKTFNNLELIARAYNLSIDSGGRDYYEAVKIGSELYNLELDASEKASTSYRKSERPVMQAAPKLYNASELVSDRIKNFIDDRGQLPADIHIDGERYMGSITHLMEKGGIIDYNKYKNRYELFGEGIPIKFDDGGIKLLVNSAKYDLKKGSVYPVRYIMARYFGLKAGGDAVDEYVLYKRICAEFRIPFETVADAKAKAAARVAELVRVDIAKAVADIGKSPEGCRRGLPLDILRELNFGWVEDWVHPANRVHGVRYTSRRLLATTPNHYEAITPLSDRDRVKSEYWKMHTSPREPFYLDVIKFTEINLIFEGAVDAASAYYALERKVACYATGGTAQYRIFTDALKAQTDERLSFVIMFDSDESGRKNAAEFQKVLTAAGHSVAVRFLSAEVTKTDCNDILIAQGKEALAERLRSCLSGVEEEFARHDADSEADDADSAQKPDEQSEKNLTTKQIITNCPIDLEVPFGYIFHRYGLYRKTSKGNVSISNTPMVITKDYDDDRHENGAVELAIYNSGTTQWHHHTLLKRLLASGTGILELAAYGASITQADAKWVSKYLMTMMYVPQNLKVIPHCKVYPAPGWTDKACKKYIHPVSVDHSYRVGNGDFDYEGAYTPRGKAKDWLDIYIPSVLKSYVMRLICGFALAAPLVYPCGSRNLQLHLCGKSGSGKTAAAKLAASIYGNPKNLLISFNGTLLALSDYALKFNDGFHVINEYQAKKRSARDDEGDVFLYGYEEGRGRARLDRNSNQRRTLPFRGARLTTGEQRLTQESGGAGAIARVLEISESEIIPDAGAVFLHNFTAENYGHYGRQWIEYIAIHSERIAKEYHELNEDIAESFEASHPAHVSMVALSYIALKHFAEMLSLSEVANAVEDAVIAVGRGYSVEERQYLSSDDFSKIFGQLPSKRGIENAERARNALSEYLFTHIGRFVIEKRVNGELYYDTPKEHLTTVGYQFASGEVGFFPRELKRILEEEYQFASADALISEFVTKGWIYPGKSAQHKYQRQRVAGRDRKIKWLYLFNAEVFE